MRASKAALLVIACLLGTVTAHGQSVPPAKGVLELFTSQGCSSCPPADKLFESYAKRDDVVALSFAVDYWDYLGWKDTLASPKFSQRQRTYAKLRGDGQVYTPQLVVNGRSHMTGSHKPEIDRALEQSPLSTSDTASVLRLRVEDNKLVVDVGEMKRPASARDATLWLAVVSRKVDVPITRGENKGRTISYFNAVRELTPIGMWNGSATSVRLERQAVMPAGADACAVLLQEGPAGPIIAAVMLRQW